MEYFNLKNSECQQAFFEKTNTTRKLTECFLKAGGVEKQAEHWFKELKGMCHQSFRKIRHKNKKKETETSILLEQRRVLLKEVSNMVAENPRNKVFENLKSLSRQDGNMNTNSVWSLKRKVFPKNKESLPFAKKNCDGKLISSHKQLKDLYLDTFVHRLRLRPIKMIFII